MKFFEAKYGQRKRPYDLLAKLDERVNQNLSADSSFVKRAEASVDRLFFKHIEVDKKPQESNLVVIEGSELESGLRLS